MHKRMEVNRSASFIRQNLDILGFKNKEEAFITTLMELLDNSIDAVVHNTKTPTEERSIVITVAKSEKANSIQIVDNGMSILRYFYECRNRNEVRFYPRTLWRDFQLIKTKARILYRQVWHWTEGDHAVLSNSSQRV